MMLSDNDFKENDVMRMFLVRCHLSRVGVAGDMLLTFLIIFNACQFIRAGVSDLFAYSFYVVCGIMCFMSHRSLI